MPARPPTALPDQALYGTLEAGIVGGGVVGGIVCGTVVAGGGGLVVGGSVVSGGGGASVVAVVVWTGGEVGAGLGEGAGPVLRGVAAPTRGWVTAVVPPGSDASGMVAGSSTIDELVVDDELEVVVAKVVVGRVVVEDGDWRATCCLGDVSSPVTTSNNRAAKATVARA